MHGATTAEGAAGSPVHAAVVEQSAGGGTLGWRAAAGAAAARVRERPSVVAAALLGFLARGGLIAFLLPIIVLPTPTGISNFIGGNALTGAGASDGLIRLIVGVLLAVMALIVAGIVAGAVSDLLLAREACAIRLGRERGAVTAADRSRAERETAAAIPLSAGFVLDLAATRIIGLIPFALAAAWAAARLGAAGYHQLITPDDTTVPLAIRILREGSDAVIVLVVMWLLTEWFAGLAVRHVISEGRSIPGAYATALAGLVRRPLTTVATFATGLAAVVVAVPILFLDAAMWTRLQAMLADGVGIVWLLAATFVFVLAWGGGLLIVGSIGAWRSLLATLDVLRAQVPVRRPAAPTAADLTAIATNEAASDLEER